MKFAFILFKYFPFGGMQRDMLRTAGHLVGMGHAVDIYTLTWEGERPSGMQVHVLPTPGLFNYQRYATFIKAVFDRLQQDEAVDYVVGYNRMPGLGAHFAADPCFVDRAKKKSWITRLTPRYRWFAKAEEAIFSRGNDCEILAVSKTEMQVFQKVYGTEPERMHYIPPYLSPERFAQQDKAEMRTHLRNLFDIPLEHQVVLLVGSGFHMKGLDRAIQAVAGLPESVRATTHLVAIGQDNPKPFEKMAHRLGVGEQVHISKGRPDIPWMMQGADVHIHPAYRENTGLVILEALASGLPSLVTDTCGYAHHVAEANAGKVVHSPFRQENLTQALAEVLESNRDTWSNNGLSYARQVMAENDGRAEANLLVQFASRKAEAVSPDMSKI